MRLIKIFALVAVLNTAAGINIQKGYAQQGSVSFQVFYDELGPYGRWIDNPSYGYVWIPNGDPGFTPYATDGHWIFTDDGWTWVSDYPWGWAAFHYGRWDYDDGYGWFWVPDNEWGPAWVSWRSSPGYYGWAPLRPGISISIAFGSGYHERNERWTFVRNRDITRSDYRGHYIDRSQNTAIINNSRVIVNTRKDNQRNVTYIAGPGRNDVQRATHTSVKSVAIRENDKPGQHLMNNELRIYRPHIQNTGTNEQKPAPSRVVQSNDVKLDGENKAETQRSNVHLTKSDPRIQSTKSVSPSAAPNNIKKQKSQSHSVKSPSTVQASQPRNIKSPGTVGRLKQPQHSGAPKENRTKQAVQPRARQEEKERGK
jgi:hypothetical protein